MKASLCGPRTTWNQHPLRPLVFSVVDQQKIPEWEKLEWVRQELGPSAALPDFAQKWSELFGDKVMGMVPQKNACIRLYSQYSNELDSACTWRKESDIPPLVREQFQRMWHQTRTLCRECGSPVHDEGKLFCSAKCEAAGVKVVCRKCEAPLNAEWPYCATCKIGSPTPHQHSILFAKAQKYWAGSRMRDPNHEPEWKRRRRSSS